MRHLWSREAGEIRVRNLIELVFVFVLVYIVFQIAPAVITRVNFLNYSGKHPLAEPGSSVICRKAKRRYSEDRFKRS